MFEIIFDFGLMSLSLTMEKQILIFILVFIHLSLSERELYNSGTASNEIKIIFAKHLLNNLNNEIHEAF